MNYYYGEHRKYGNKKLEYEGAEFDSKRELARWKELELMARAGQIYGLVRQVPYLLIPTQRGADGKVIERECRYIADFVYYKDGNTMVVEDAKGYRTPEYKIKRKLMLSVYGIRIQEV